MTLINPTSDSLYPMAMLAPMSVLQRRIAAREAAIAFREAKDKAELHGMKLTKDSERGYWIQFGNEKRYVRYLEDVSGWINYLETWS